MTTQDTEAMLAERGKTHGDFSHHAGVTQALMRVMQTAPNWETLPDVIKETLHMNAHKVARVLTGNPFLHDHYDDVAGYAKLIPQRTIDGVGLLPEHAAIAARYADDRATPVATHLHCSVSGAEATPEKIREAIQKHECKNRQKESLVLAAQELAGSRSYADFYRAVAMRAGVTRDEAKIACLELGYDKTGRKSGRRASA